MAASKPASFLAAAVVAVLSVPPVVAEMMAQAPPPAQANATLLADLAKDWESQKDMMMKIADAMPEDKFGYKSTPAQRDYGAQIVHVATAHVMLMKLLDASTPAPAFSAESAKTKTEILKALADAYDFGTTQIKKQSDQSIMETVQGPRFLGPSTRARIVYRAMGHAFDIYGQMAVYLRLNGIVPPASRGV